MKQSIVVSLFLGIISVAEARHKHHHYYGKNLLQARDEDES